MFKNSEVFFDTFIQLLGISSKVISRNPGKDVINVHIGVYYLYTHAQKDIA